jgi:hypothetical protein
MKSGCTENQHNKIINTVSPMTLQAVSENMLLDARLRMEYSGAQIQNFL